MPSKPCKRAAAARAAAAKAPTAAAYVLPQSLIKLGWKMVCDRAAGRVRRAVGLARSGLRGGARVVFTVRRRGQRQCQQRRHVQQEVLKGSWPTVSLKQLGGLKWIRKS